MRLKAYILLLLLLTVSTSFATNNYLETTDVIAPDSVSNPVKGASHTDSTTGATWVRRSDISELNTPGKYGQIVYSRFSPSNSSGQYLLVHGGNSTSCFVYRLSDNTVVADLKRDATHQIGEVNEIRWDYTGNYPNRVYFVSGMSFYYMDVISGNGSPTLIRNFASDFPSGDHIMNDVEGDSSADSRYWAWQVLGAYSSGTYPRLAIITYDKQTDAILGTLTPSSVIPTTNASSWTTKMPPPNMVEISPDGTKVITHYGRSYPGGTTQDFTGTYFDAPHAWNLNFKGTPVKVSADETHSGWGYLADGTQVFVSQQNRTDKLQYCRTDGVGGSWPNNCADFIDHAATGYFGMHFAKMPSSKPGWILISTYDKYATGWSASTSYSFPSKIVVNGYIYYLQVAGVSGSSAPTWPTTVGATVYDGGITWACWGSAWPLGQLLMVELKPIAQNPRVWRISPQYNNYQGSYFDEGSAAISQNGEMVYVTNNWMNVAAEHGDAFEVDITGWSTYYGITESTCNNEIQDGDETGVDCGGSCSACSTPTLLIPIPFRIPGGMPYGIVQ